ncbi:uncharacterized protein BN465_00468 [Prevotella sp. CAG:1092]|nr:uncharacterized protein BN465_00468 [Prevotella sp. CAG:1092]
MISKNHEVYKHKHILLVEDHTNPLGIVRSLGEEGIHPIVLLCSKNPQLVNKSKYVGELHIFNTINEGYNYLISHYGKEKLKPFIYNGSDDITLLLDSHYEDLKDKFYFTNGQGGIEKYLQKYDITQAAVECGLQIPKEELLEVGQMPKTLKYPVFTKAATSAKGGGWKDQAHICNNEDELRKAYTQIHADNILVQEFIKKKNELCIDGISINGGEEVFMPYACSYYRFRPDSYGNYMYFFPFTDEKLIENIKRLIKQVHFTGIFCIEFLIDNNDELYFLEVNFRNSGWSYAFTKGGFNLPFRWAVSMLDNTLFMDSFKPLEKFDAMQEIGDYYEFVKSKKIPLIKWLKEVKASYLFLYNSKDPAPFWNFLLQKIKNKLC